MKNDKKINKTLAANLQLNVRTFEEYSERNYKRRAFTRSLLKTTNVYLKDDFLKMLEQR